MRALYSGVLPLARLLRFERMVSRYKQVYRHFAPGGASKVEHRKIEHLQREKKNHRGVDFGWLRFRREVYPLHSGTNSC